MALSLPVAAEAARIAPAGASASSTYPDEEGISYDASKATDGKLSTSWVEGDQGAGLGAYLDIDLGGAHHVKSVKVWGGMQYSNDYWKRGNRPKELEIDFSDGSKQSFTMTDDMKGQEIVLPAAKDTSSIRVKLKSVYDGTTWLDTGISEVQVFDDGAPDRVPIVKATASTTLPADADGSYDPMNVSDGLSDSMWCEGNKTGDGTGEWLQVNFAGPTAVSSMTLINGIGTSLPFWMKANRAGAATLTFSDGSTADVTLKNAMLPQTVTFPAKTTSSVKISFSAITRGKEFNDLCISEAYFPE